MRSCKGRVLFKAKLGLRREDDVSLMCFPGELSVLETVGSLGQKESFLGSRLHF